MKINNFLLKFTFLLIVNGGGWREIVAMDLRETSIKQFFAKIWTDSLKEVSCLKKCIEDRGGLLKIVKHLIGGEHVLDVSEIKIKSDKQEIPVCFLFVLENEKEVSFLKFLRELYSLSNDSKSGHPQGALSILESGNKCLQDKLKAVASLIVTFGYAQQSEIFGYKKIQGQISNLQKNIEKNAAIEKAAKCISRFSQNTQNPSEGLKNNLSARLSKEKEIYTKAGMNVNGLESLDTNALKNDLSPLTNALTDMRSKIPVVLKLNNISEKVNDIAASITSTYFSEEGKTEIDQLIINKFCEPVQRYLQNFLQFEDLTIEKDKTIKKGDKEKKDTIGISLIKKFPLETNSTKNEKFKAFICESAKQNETENETIKSLSPPSRSVKVTLSLRSELCQPPKEEDEKITVDKGEKSNNEYGISSTYLATFFPSAH